MVLSVGSPTGSRDGGPLPAQGATVAQVASHAEGLELLGVLEGSGYREPPWLVRRADGQMLQLTPVLFSVLEAIDGHRTSAEVADAVQAARGFAIDPEDIEFLIEEKLLPIGVLRLPDGSEPVLRRSNPLLGLRGRVVMVGASRTAALAQRLSPLFRPTVVLAITALFVATSWWLFSTEDLGAATRDLFHQPGALLAVLALTIASGAFHEIGHAAACRYGGAEPGPMGAGLYLVWPAFYTDVSDSYRLDRRGRLRVDLGGLYFNAIFSVAAFAAWLVVGWNPLLIVMVLQLFQMARQLAPLVRFDGYHVLADLVGVPDLFARVKPVLIGLLPTRWRHPEARLLKPWARLVVSLWVLIVVPILLASLLMIVLSFPRLAATAAESLSERWSDLRHHWSRADLLRMTLSSVTMLTIALPVAGVTYLVSRITRRVGTRAWGATEGHPPARRALVVASIALVVALAAAWWPQGQYRAIDADEQLRLPAIAGLADARTPAEEAPGSSGGDRTAAEARRGLRNSQLATAPEVADAGRVGGHDFAMPAPPREHDNQAVAVGYEDGATEVEVAHSMDFAEAGDVDHRNEAHALASCADCRTTAVAFQLVLVIGEHRHVAPRNVAVAKNVQCLRCATRALAVQLVLPMDQRPSGATIANLNQIWKRLTALDERMVNEQGVGAAQALLHDVEADLVALLAPGSDVLEETTTTTAVATSGSTTTSTTVGDGAATTAPPRTESDGSTSTTSSSSTSTTASTSSTTTTTTNPPGG